jgi:hypothetical protein
LDPQTAMTSRSESGSPQGCTSRLAYGLAAFLLVGSTILAYLDRIGLADRTPGVTATNRLWAALAIVAAGCLLLEGLVAALFLAVRSRRSWLGALTISLIGLGVSLGVGCVGLRWVAEERRLGGDTGPVGVIAAWLFGVIVPLVMATLPLGLFSICLFRLRPYTIGKAKSLSRKGRVRIW